MPSKQTQKQTKSRANVRSSSTLKTRPRFNKKIALLLTILIAGIGAYFLFFADAATNNCQAIDRVQICDVDMTVGSADTILSVTGEAQNLGNQKWGMYFGTDFRAPTTEYNGAVPITRVYNESASLHDWVTDTQKTAKEAKYGAVKNQGVAFFAWKTQVQDTVPVYRLGRGGTAGEGSQNVYSVDKAWVDKMLADDANNPNGWKKDQFGPFIAFYAYPVNYKVADQANPYDCSIQVNFLSDRCKMQRESLIASQTPSTPTTSTPTTKPTTTTTTVNPTPSTSNSSGSTSTSKPITPVVPPADIPKYAECPKTIEAYQDGANRLKLNFSQDCHTWWWTTAKNQGALADFYGQIKDCTDKGGYYYDFNCNPYSQAQVDYFRKLEALKINCQSNGGIWNAARTACEPNIRPALSAAPLGWSCKIMGIQRIYGFGAGYSKKSVTVYPNVEAYTKDEAKNVKCVKWRTAMNVQEQYQDFKVIDAKLLSETRGLW